MAQMSGSAAGGPQNSGVSGSRLAYIDNLRVYLTILVILHHTAIVYGGSGDWPVKEGTSNLPTEIVFTLFNAVNQAYFMAVFFLFAGYFTPRSFEKKGPGRFILDRFIRLGIPILVWSVLLAPLQDFIILRFDKHLDVSYLGLVRNGLGDFTIRVDHLWFLEALLLFALAYAAYRWLAPRAAPARTLRVYPERFPPTEALWASMFGVTVLTFLVRLASPVGEWTLGLQFGHVVSYVFFFCCGVLAYRGGWFDLLARATARTWGIISLEVIALAPVIMVVGGALEEGGTDAFEGGIAWQALLNTWWESTLLIGITIWFVRFFRDRVTYHGRLAHSLAASAYTAYIIHPPIVISLTLAMRQVDVPSAAKFAVVGSVAVVLAFALSEFVFRRIPYAKRVLG